MKQKSIFAAFLLLGLFMFLMSVSFFVNYEKVSLSPDLSVSENIEGEVLCGLYDACREVCFRSSFVDCKFWENFDSREQCVREANGDGKLIRECYRRADACREGLDNADETLEGLWNTCESTFQGSGGAFICLGGVIRGVDCEAFEGQCHPEECDNAYEPIIDRISSVCQWTGEYIPGSGCNSESGSYEQCLRDYWKNLEDDFYEEHEQDLFFCLDPR